MILGEGEQRRWLSKAGMLKCVWMNERTTMCVTRRSGGRRIIYIQLPRLRRVLVQVRYEYVEAE